jgi:hypothetical protein
LRSVEPCQDFSAQASPSRLSGAERSGAEWRDEEAAEQNLAKMTREIDRGHVSATDELIHHGVRVLFFLHWIQCDRVITLMVV